MLHIHLSIKNGKLFACKYIIQFFVFNSQVIPRISSCNQLKYTPKTTD